MADYSLQILTNSTTGSVDKVQLWFFTPGNNWYNEIQFKAPIEASVSSCGWSSLRDAPTQQIKVWTLTVTSSTFLLQCNGFDVRRIVFADVQDDGSKCAETWTRDLTELKLNFNNQDTASLKYRKQTGTALIKSI